MTTRMIRMLTTATLLGNFAMLGLVGCAHEGPMERAGRHVDKAAHDVKKDIKK